VICSLKAAAAAGGGGRGELLQAVLPMRQRKNGGRWLSGPYRCKMVQIIQPPATTLALRCGKEDPQERPPLLLPQALQGLSSYKAKQPSQAQKLRTTAPLQSCTLARFARSGPLTKIMSSREAVKFLLSAAFRQQQPAAGSSGSASLHPTARAVAGSMVVCERGPTTMGPATALAPGCGEADSEEPPTAAPGTAGTQQLLRVNNQPSHSPAKLDPLAQLWCSHSQA
jgi:hypothetical protein